MSLPSDQTALGIIHSFAEDPSAPNVRNRFVIDLSRLRDLVT